MANPITTIGGIKNAIIVTLGIDTTSAYYTDAILDDFIDQAHKFCAGYKKWAMTEGRSSTTSASLGVTEDGYSVLEYPEGWRSDTIRLLTIGGKHFNKKNFYKFQQFLEDNSADTSRIYTDYARRVLINPNANTLTGTVVAFGQYIPATLDATDPTVATVFSNFDTYGNQAIVEEVLSYCAKREKQAQSVVDEYHKRAIDILDSLGGAIAEEQAMYQDTLNEGMYKRFDVLRGGFKEDLFKRDQWSNG